jgi:hypothetical protein
MSNLTMMMGLGSGVTTPVPDAIGAEYGGGFYAGNIIQDGTEYYIIVAPKSSGQNSSKQWKTSNSAAPAATQTLNNGPAASASMDSSTYPAAQFCEGLTIGEYTDWYFPARDELELCYRNLKPTTSSNSTGNRAKSSISYPENNDLSADTIGINRNSSPAGGAYTSGTPSQTSATDFQTGGAEAFDAGDYSCSTEYSSTGYWEQDFSNGGQNGPMSKTRAVRVRAVRRVPV